MKAITRKITREARVGNIGIGGDNPIRVQSMTKTDTRDVPATVRQIKEMEAAGCEIVRLAVPDRASVEPFREIKQQVSAPLVADIHFDASLALGALEAGADKIRINPGNTAINPQRKDELFRIIDRAGELGAAIRIGVNAGSVEPALRRKYGGATPEAMAESATTALQLCESRGFTNLVVSLKHSSVPETVEVYQRFAEVSDYPLHLGVTEAGPPLVSAVRSSLALGALLSQGIGDTIRISATSEPMVEIKIAYEILQSLGIRRRSATLISCPTCGRIEVDLIPIVQEVEAALLAEKINVPVSVSVMGCLVNGPGEGREADFGISYPGRAEGATKVEIWSKGKVLAYVDKEEAVPALIEAIKSSLNNSSPQPEVKDRQL